MVRVHKLLFCMLLTLFANAAAAQTAWTVTEAAGKVVVRDAAGDRAARRGTVIAAGATLWTGPSSRAVVVRGRDFVTVAANSRIRIPTTEQVRGKFEVLQEWGNAVFQIEKKPNPHFGVRTPYLAAVVKGTTFSITVTAEGASLQVVEGAVETSTGDGGARELIRPGIVASVAAADRYRLTVQGQDTRTIDSPQRPTVAPDASTPPPADGDQATPQAGIGEDATPNPGEAADATLLETQMIVEPIASRPVDLGKVTDGLVGGTNAVQLASLDIAVARNEAADKAPGAENPGNGNGGGTDNPGTDNPGNGNGNGGGNGNPGTDNPGNGNGNGGGTDNPGTDNPGNGNGNGGGNGNPGTDNPGNGNGNGGGNGNPGTDNPGNGNGNGGGTDNPGTDNPGNGNGNGGGNSGGNDGGNPGKRD